MESYRNADNRVCHRTILNVGFMEDVTVDQLNKIQKQLTQRYERKQVLFEQEEDDPIVKKYVEGFWQRIVASKKFDLAWAEKLSRMVNMDTLQHSNAREVGAENIAYQTWGKLQLTTLLLSHGFTQEQAMLAATQVVSRAVYPASELKTTRWIKENSAVCELTGYDQSKITKDKLYESSLHLYKVKDALEKHLSSRTNELFDLADKIILYDLTKEENLKLIEEKGYKYLCVSRTKLKDYKYVPGRLTTLLDTKSKQTIRLRISHHRKKHGLLFRSQKPFQGKERGGHETSI